MNPQNGYVAYIVNPKSGPSVNKLLIQRFEQGLLKKGFEVHKSQTESLEHARQLAETAAGDNKCGFVVAAGGDGTVREVAHGLEGSDKALIILPCGTENLLANELGFNNRMKTAIQLLDNGEFRRLDMCNCNGKCFASVCGVGFDAEVIELVTKNRRGHITYLDYIWPIWQTFWTHRFPALTVHADGEKVYEGKGLVFVGNISRYAIGLPILRDADYGDGLLDLCIFKCSSKLHLMKHSLMVVLKRHVECKNVIYRKCKNVIISSPDTVKSELDGDPGPALPLEVSVLPQAVRVLVPKSSHPAGMRTRLRRAIG